MKNGKPMRVPKAVLSRIVFCAGAIVAFMLIANYPAQMSVVKLDNEIAETKGRIEEQKLLSPIYSELMAKVRLKAVAGATLSRDGLAQDKVDRIAEMLREVARKSDIETISVVPDPKSLAGGSNLLTVNVSARGDFFAFRGFLLDLGSLSYVGSLDEVRVRDVSGNKEYNLKMKIALKK
jgi:hypothetical protein